jgi:aquaporin Z
MDKERTIQPYLAEMIGTFLLVFIGAGAVCMNAVAAPGDKLGLLGIAVAHGVALAIAVTATMNISGGHINPAVTIAFWVYKKIDTDKAIGYIVAQLLGGVIAGGLLVFIFTRSGGALDVGYGTPHINGLEQLPDSGSYPRLKGIVIEIFLTFILMFAIMGTAVDPRAPRVGGFGVGLAIMIDILMAGPLVGAAMNPARAFGPGLWEAGVRMDFNYMWDQFVYWVGPIIGAILAAGLYINYILPPEPAHKP